jgi:hypothetical protein
VTAPGAPRDAFGDLVARAREARAALDDAESRWRAAVDELSAYVSRASLELSDDERREADALIAVRREHRRVFHPPPS